MNEIPSTGKKNIPPPSRGWVWNIAVMLMLCLIAGEGAVIGGSMVWDRLALMTRPTQTSTRMPPTTQPTRTKTPMPPTAQPTRTSPLPSRAASPTVNQNTGKHGMTWGKVAHYDEFGIDLVGCHGQPRLDGTSDGPACDPYQGDTRCSVALPILCLNPENLPRPNYAVSGTGYSMVVEYYYGWAGGHIGLTLPILGTKLTGVEAANSMCVAALGPGYRMAEHHDGKYVIGMGTDQYYGDTWPPQSQLNSGGWNWYAYGNLPGDTRFWVNINDQPGNCWK